MDRCTQPRRRPCPTPLWLGLVATLLCVGTGCEDEASDASPTGIEAPPADTQAGDHPGSPHPGAPKAGGEDEGKALDTGPPAPAMGCRVEGSVALGANLGAARVAVHGDAWWVASYARDQGERSLARFRVTRELAVRALPSLPLGQAGESAPRVPPAIHAGRSLWIAATDAVGALSLWPDADSDTPEPVALAPRVDPRFTPALRELGEARALVAYTEGDATGMRVQAVVRNGEQLTRHALTPLGHGATAPHFIEGAPGLELLMLDARSGMSPLLRVPFDAAGNPSTAVVDRPVNLPYSPPSLVGVQLPKARAHAAYTAIGNGATAAVGLVPLGATDPPVAVLRGTGYALLAVDVEVGPTRALFAVDAPLSAEPDPALEVQLRVWDGNDLGPPLHLPSAAGSRMRPAIAYDAASRRVVLVSVAARGVDLHALRCDL